MTFNRLLLAFLACIFLSVTTRCKKDDPCPDCVLRIDNISLKSIRQNGNALENATYNAHEIRVIVDGEVQGHERYLFMDSISEPFLGTIPVAIEDTTCNAYAIGSSGQYEWCPISDSPTIEIDYSQGRNGLPNLSGVFTTPMPFAPLFLSEYKDITFVSGDLTLVVDITFTNSPYKE